MQRKITTEPRRVRSRSDVEAAAKSLADSVERLRKRNLEMAAYLHGVKGDDAISRVANAPHVDLDDATERARRYWDKLEGRRSSVPPGKISEKNDAKENNGGRTPRRAAARE